MEVKKFIKEQMEFLGVPYEFGEWTSEIKYPYFVGEVNEPDPTTEDGLEEPYFILTGFNRGKYIDLEIIREKIKKHFQDLRASIDSGSIAVFYGGAFYVPTGEADLKKLQINLNIKTWKGDL